MAETYDKKTSDKEANTHGFQVSLAHDDHVRLHIIIDLKNINVAYQTYGCLLYTSDAADE